MKDLILNITENIEFNKNTDSDYAVESLSSIAVEMSLKKVKNAVLNGTEDRDLSDVILSAIYNYLYQSYDETIDNLASIIISDNAYIVNECMKKYLSDATKLLISDNLKTVSTKYIEIINKMIEIRTEYILGNVSLHVDGNTIRVVLLDLVCLENKENKNKIPILCSPYNTEVTNVIDDYNKCICKNSDIFLSLLLLEKADKKEYTAIDFAIRVLFGYGISELLERFCY